MHAGDLKDQRDAGPWTLSHEEDRTDTGQSAPSLTWGKAAGVGDHKLCAFRINQGPVTYVHTTHTNMCATPNMCACAHEYVCALPASQCVLRAHVCA